MREYVPVNPGISADSRNIAANGMEQESASGRQQFMRFAHEGPVILVADMLEHSDRIDCVERLT